MVGIEYMNEGRLQLQWQSYLCVSYQTLHLNSHSYFYTISIILSTGVKGQSWNITLKSPYKLNDTTIKKMNRNRGNKEMLNVHHTARPH